MVTPSAISHTGAWFAPCDLDPVIMNMDLARLEARIMPPNQGDPVGTPLRSSGGHGTDHRHRSAPQHFYALRMPRFPWAPRTAGGRPGYSASPGASVSPRTGFPVAEHLADHLIGLPMYPGLSLEQVDEVAGADLEAASMVEARS